MPQAVRPSIPGVTLSFSCPSMDWQGSSEQPILTLLTLDSALPQADASCPFDLTQWERKTL